MKQYENFKFQQPYQQAMYYCSLLLLDQSWPWNDELEVLSVLEPQDLSRFYPQILSRTFIECYAAGSYTPVFLLQLILSFSYLL